MNQGALNRNDELSVFICENDEVSREILKKYFEGGKVTYVSMIPSGKREELVELIEKLDDA
jgi:hypothetical protein